MNHLLPGPVIGFHHYNFKTGCDPLVTKKGGSHPILKLYWQIDYLATESRKQSIFFIFRISAAGHWTKFVLVLFVGMFRRDIFLKRSSCAKMKLAVRLIKATKCIASYHCLKAKSELKSYCHKSVKDCGILPWYSPLTATITLSGRRSFSSQVEVLCRQCAAVSTVLQWWQCARWNTVPIIMKMLQTKFEFPRRK